MAKVTIYTKSNCPYCVRAKQLFKNKSVSFEEIDLDDKYEEYQTLKNKTGLMTVPQIFINEKLIGGYTEAATLDQEGQLDQLLND